MSAEDTLTEPQRKLLADVRRDGTRVYNGRARSRIEALEKAGLVTADWDAELDAQKNRLRWYITVWPKDADAPEGSLGVCAVCGGDYPVRADHALAAHERYQESPMGRDVRLVPCEGSGAKPESWAAA